MIYKIIEKNDIDIIIALTSEIMYMQSFEGKNDLKFGNYVNDYISFSNIFDLLENNSILFVGAFDGDAITGYGCVDNTGRLSLLFVGAPYRNSGIGKELCEKCSFYAKKNFKKKNIYIDNYPSYDVDLLKRLGFNQSNVNGSDVFFYHNNENISPANGKRILLFAAIIPIIVIISFSFFIISQKNKDSKFDDTELALADDDDNDSDRKDKDDKKDKDDDGKDKDDDIIDINDDVDSTDDDDDLYSFFSDYDYYSEEDYERLDDGFGWKILDLAADSYIQDNLSYSLEMASTYNNASIFDLNCNYPVLTFDDGRDSSNINTQIYKNANIIAQKLFDASSELSPDEIASGDYTFADFVYYEINYASDEWLCITFCDHYFYKNIFGEYFDVSSLVINLDEEKVYTIDEIIDADIQLADQYFNSLSSTYDDFNDMVLLCPDVLFNTLTGEYVENRYKTAVTFNEDGPVLIFNFNYSDPNFICRGFYEIQYDEDDISSLLIDFEY